MPFALIALLALGAVALVASRKSTSAATGGGEGPPAIDPVTVDPGFSEPRAATQSGAVYLQGSWPQLAALRLLRYRIGAQDTTASGALRRAATLTYKGNLDDIPSATAETALGWIKQQSAAGKIILVSSNLVMGPFTESKANAKLFNPSIPADVNILAIDPGKEPIEAAPGKGIAVLVAKPGGVATLPDTTKEIVTNLLG